jgi:signal transduction histidine kinase
LPAALTTARRLAIVWGVWTIVGLASALSIGLRIASGEFTPRLALFSSSIVAVPVWTLVTPPVLALSRRFPLERGRWVLAFGVHLCGLAVALSMDGAASWAVDHFAFHGRLTWWQHLWRYSFIDAFFYLGIVAAEHVSRYYRLYVDRRLRASELEAQLSRAQLHALQMQLRPHFLFNAFNTIAGLVRVGDGEAAVTMLAGLSDLLRLLLRGDGTQEVPIRQELDVIQRYLRIEQARFDHLEVDLFVQPGVENALVPSLILQPLVENAVKHGTSSSSGRVCVRVERSGERLRLVVSDSGDDGPKSQGNGIGLANTRARLTRLYGDAHRFLLAQTVSGTSAIIELPLRLAPLGTKAS